MVKNEVQEERMRGYFIQAAKDIIRGEGLKVVSARNIADRAGYSYATLYNYFDDIKNLVFESVKDFQEECLEFIDSYVKIKKPGIERLKQKLKAYMLYFVQYPGIFELFYLERAGDLARKDPTCELIYSFLDKICEEDWQALVSEKRLSAKDAELKRAQLRFITAGMLLFYLNRKQPADYSEFIKESERQIKGVMTL